MEFPELETESLLQRIYGLLLAFNGSEQIGAIKRCTNPDAVYLTTNKSRTFKIEVMELMGQ